LGKSSGKEKNCGDHGRTAFISDLERPLFLSASIRQREIDMKWQMILDLNLISNREGTSGADSEVQTRMIDNQVILFQNRTKWPFCPARGITLRQFGLIDLNPTKHHQSCCIHWTIPSVTAKRDGLVGGSSSMFPMRNDQIFQNNR
jgi:hypothetical protein